MVVVAVVVMAVVVCVSGGVNKMGVCFFSSVTLTEKLLDSGRLLEEYFRNVSVC